MPQYSKYTFEYDAHIESQMDSICVLLSDKIKSSKIAHFLEFVILGGGYGRGEGGIYISENNEKHLYNDLDFFVITKPEISSIDNAQIISFFKEISKELHEESKIDVDFSTPTPLNYIQERMNLMVWKEMALGGMVIFGDEKLFHNCFPAELKNSKISPSELLKLAMNRASGLVFALEKLQEADFDSEVKNFVARNINKAILAAGDIFLYAKNNLPLRTSERLELIEKSCENAEFLNAYKDAVNFKKYPHFHSDKDAALKDLSCATNLLKEICKQNWDIINSKSDYGFKRRIRDIIFNLKHTEEVFCILKDPKARLLNLAFGILEIQHPVNKAIFTNYKKRWEELS